METIVELANFLNVTYSDETISELVTTIDNINERFAKWIHHHFVATFDMDLHFDLTEKILDPYLRTIWNRVYDDLSRPHQHPSGNYTCMYVHGHHNEAPPPGGPVYSLDNNDLGKGPACFGYLNAVDLAIISNDKHPKNQKNTYYTMLKKEFNETILPSIAHKKITRSGIGGALHALHQGLEKAGSCFFGKPVTPHSYQQFKRDCNKYIRSARLAIPKMNDEVIAKFHEIDHIINGVGALYSQNMSRNPHYFFRHPRKRQFPGSSSHTDKTDHRLGINGRAA